MKFEEPNTTDTAMQKLKVILQEAIQPGSFDEEPDRIKNIMDRLKKGDITPDQAIAEAENIENDRQDSYH